MYWLSQVIICCVLHDALSPTLAYFDEIISSKVFKGLKRIVQDNKAVKLY